jgi:D-threo-aldose 1-dehydrogenase
VATVCLGARSAGQVDRNAALLDAAVPDAAWSELVSEGLLRPDAPVPTAV